VHYLAHIPYRPPTRLGRWIKQYHLLHHFHQREALVRRQQPALDGAFGTLADPAPRKRAHHPQLPFLREGFPSRGKAGVIEWRFSGTFRS
jgi:hypothetical protein